MLELYRALANLALSEFSGIVVSSQMIGGTPADPDKLRLAFKEESFLDIWLSEDNDYACHWEHRRQSGKIYRWDNAPHHPEVSTYPKHFHDGDESAVTGSALSSDSQSALRGILKLYSTTLIKMSLQGTPALSLSKGSSLLESKDCSPALHRTQCGASVAQCARNDIYSLKILEYTSEVFINSSCVPMAAIFPLRKTMIKSAQRICERR